MKRTLLLTLVVLSIASLAMAQSNVGSIGVFSDQTGTDCNLTDVAFEFINAYVLHVNADAANTSQFRVAVDGDIDATYLSATVNPSLLSLGNPNTGVVITYVGCQTSFPLLLVTLQFFGAGTTTSCGKVRLLGDPTSASGEVEVVDCSSNKVVLGPEAGSAMFHTTPGFCGCDVATKESNWSKIKALYR